MSGDSAGLLRAMAENYKNGHQWDHLDGEAVTEAADEIDRLRVALIDLDSAFSFQPSCQAVVVQKCYCLACVKARVRELLTPNAIGQRCAACGASAAPTGCAADAREEGQ